MSIWSKIIESVGGNVSAKEEVSRDASRYAIVDCEVGIKDKRVHDIGALRWDGATFHAADNGYDAVEGGVANDQVIDTVEDYENGRITAEQALDQLRFKNPNHQLCIRNQAIITQCLRFRSCYTVKDED